MKVKKRENKKTQTNFLSKKKCLSLKKIESMMLASLKETD